VAREHYLDYKFRSKHDLPNLNKRFADVAQLSITDMQRQLDAGAGRKVFKDYVKVIESYFIPFFGKVFITNRAALHHIETVMNALNGLFWTYPTINYLVQSAGLDAVAMVR
ncbi:MAG: hypothetical protein OSA51_13325, partial [Octadecabacter sp.]|nr:hypothetical protein [Octadecabacter sp.]